MATTPTFTGERNNSNTCLNEIAFGSGINITGTISASAGGAAHAATSQVTTSTTAGTLAIARATRVSCLVRNLDASITVYVGKATVTSGNGTPLKAGESFAFTTQELVQVIAASGTPVVSVFDEYS
jgi:hypothetical protein